MIKIPSKFYPSLFYELLLCDLLRQKSYFETTTTYVFPFIVVHSILAIFPDMSGFDCISCTMSSQ